MTPARDRRGFALLAALALLGAISMVALELATAGRARRLAAANALEHAAASAAAQAGVEDVRARLVRLLWDAQGAGAAQRVVDPWAGAHGLRIGATPVGDYRYDVAVADAGASLDLNRVAEPELRRMLATLRVDAARADRLAQAIADWRDGDDLRRARGAERADYLAAGSPALPRNAPFASVGELRGVAGMSDVLLEELRPYVRVVGTGRVNLNAAPAPVLVALPGMGEEAASHVLRLRRQGRRVTDLGRLALELSAGARRRMLDELPALGAATSISAREMMVTSVARDANGVERARVEALVVMDAGARVAWRRVSP